MIRILGRGGGTAEGPPQSADVASENSHQAIEPLQGNSRLPPDPLYIASSPAYPSGTHYDAQPQQLAPPNYSSARDPYAFYQDPPYSSSAPRAMGRHDPFSNDRPWYRRVPVLTITVVVACVIVFIVTMGVNNCPAQPQVPGYSCVLQFLGRFSFEPLKVNPMLGPSSQTLLDMGAINSVYVIDYHQSWRLLTAMWLHAGVIHIVANMLGIYFLGAPLEREYGFVKLTLVYLLSGISGGILSSLLLGNTVSVGASGALFGLAGATLTELIINWDLYANRVSALVSLVAIIIINLLIGLLPYVDNFAHIGGCLAGLLLGLTLLVKPQRGYVDMSRRDNVAAAASAAEAGGVVVTARNTICQNITRVFAAVAFLALFFTGLGFILSGHEANCSWCHYLTCVPISNLWDCNSYGSPPSGGSGPVCQQITYNNGTGVLVCTNSTSRSFANITNYSQYQLRVLCSETCS